MLVPKSFALLVCFNIIPVAVEMAKLYENKQSLIYKLQFNQRIKSLDLASVIKKPLKITDPVLALSKSSQKI